MKIIDKTLPFVKFETIKIGHAFQWGNRYWLKVKPFTLDVYTTEYNCVRIGSADCTVMDDNEEVQAINTMELS